VADVQKAVRLWRKPSCRRAAEPAARNILDDELADEISLWRSSSHDEKRG
jgi:hypothetical protein